MKITPSISDRDVHFTLCLHFRDKTNFADLAGLARIKMVTKMSGYHKVHPIVKLADGTMLIADREEGSTVDWLESDIAVGEPNGANWIPSEL